MQWGLIFIRKSEIKSLKYQLYRLCQ